MDEVAQQGAADAPNADLTAQILLGAIVEAAHGVVLAQDKADALRQAKATVRKMLRAEVRLTASQAPYSGAVTSRI